MQIGKTLKCKQDTEPAKVGIRPRGSRLSHVDGREVQACPERKNEDATHASLRTRFQTQPSFDPRITVQVQPDHGREQVRSHQLDLDHDLRSLCCPDFDLSFTFPEKSLLKIQVTAFRASSQTFGLTSFWRLG